MKKRKKACILAMTIAVACAIAYAGTQATEADAKVSDAIAAASWAKTTAAKKVTLGYETDYDKGSSATKELGFCMPENQFKETYFQNGKKIWAKPKKGSYAHVYRYMTFTVRLSNNKASKNLLMGSTVTVPKGVSASVSVEQRCIAYGSVTCIALGRWVSPASARGTKSIKAKSSAYKLKVRGMDYAQ